MIRLPLLAGLLLAVAYAAESDCLSPDQLKMPVLPNSGVVGEVTLTSKPHCRPATASAEVEWLSVTVAPPGTSDSSWTLRYFAQPNFTAHLRKGEVIVGKQKMTVEQEAGPRPAIAAGPGRLEFFIKKPAEKAEKQILHVASDDSELLFSAAPGDKEKAWLHVEKQADGHSFAISPDPKGLNVGEYNGRILIEAPGRATARSLSPSA